MTHWRATSRNPHEKSTAAFLLTGHELIAEQEGPHIPLWIPPQDIEAIPSEMRPLWVLQNTSLQQAEDSRRARATSMINKILRKELIGKYDHPDVKAVLHGLMQLQQIACKKLYDLVEEMPEPPTIQPANAIIFCVKSALRAEHQCKSDNALNDMTADLMSRGIPVGEATSYGTNRNHVRRAEQAFLKSLGLIVSRFDEPLRSTVLDVQIGYWSERVEVLLALEARAAKVPRFRGLSGKALVEAIDRRPGILTAYLRESARKAA